MEVKFENIVKRDLLEGGKKYIRDSRLTFDTISFEIVTDGIIVRFYGKGEKLVQLRRQINISDMGSFEFHLTEGSMEIGIE